MELNGVAYKEVFSVCGNTACGGPLIPQSTFIGSDGLVRIDGYCHLCRKVFYRIFTSALIESLRPPAPIPTPKHAAEAGMSPTDADIKFMKDIGMQLLPAAPLDNTISQD